MTMFGLESTVVEPLVRSIAGDQLDAKAMEDRFARATWSGIAEPGDRVAGRLISAIGAGAALTAIADKWDAKRLRAAMPAEPATLAELEAGIARWQPRVSPATAVLALRQAARYKVRLLIPGDPSWPTGFVDLEDFGPIALWLRGNESTLATSEQSIALVGARAATGYGEHITMEASAGLVDRGYTIVSGAAYGIDGMAHRAALASSGQTIAFMAGGVDRFYPSGHDALLGRIVDAGAVVSELPCGSPPTKWRFLQRNRLIAAASLATIVLEAGWRSGSLNTAGHAAAIGRPLGAVPGPVTSAASAGCHRLIREFDATLVTSAEEMAELAPLQPAAATLAIASYSPDTVRVLDAMSTRSPRAAVEIASRSGLSVDSVRAVLGSLQLEDVAKEGERGWTKRG
ncbi:MAG: dprA [Microbacteriaceae bacterium]|nr:dprA [Microbacteriaceae bacterium]